MNNRRKDLKNFTVIFLIVMFLVTVIWVMMGKTTKMRESKSDITLSEKGAKQQAKAKGKIETQIAGDKARIIEIEKLFERRNLDGNTWDTLYQETDALRSRIKAGETIGDK